MHDSMKYDEINREIGAIRSGINSKSAVMMEGFKAIFYSYANLDEGDLPLHDSSPQWAMIMTDYIGHTSSFKKAMGITNHAFEWIDMIESVRIVAGSVEFPTCQEPKSDDIARIEWDEDVKLEDVIETMSIYGSVDQPHSWMQVRTKMGSTLNVDYTTTMLEKKFSDIDWSDNPHNGITVQSIDENGNPAWMPRYKMIPTASIWNNMNIEIFRSDNKIKHI